MMDRLHAQSLITFRKWINVNDRNGLALRTVAAVISKVFAKGHTRHPRNWQRR